MGMSGLLTVSVFTNYVFVVIEISVDFPAAEPVN